MDDFSGHTTLGASGLEVRKMGIGADAGIPARALEWAFERGVNYFYWGSRRRPGMKEAIRKLAASRREKMVIALQTYDYTGLALRQTFTQGLRALADRLRRRADPGKPERSRTAAHSGQGARIEREGIGETPLRERPRPLRIPATPGFEELRPHHGALQRRPSRSRTGCLPPARRAGEARCALLQLDPMGPPVRSALDARRARRRRVQSISTGTSFPTRTSTWSSPLRRRWNSSRRT